MSLPVGTQVRLKVKCLGNEPGTVGLVFHDYKTGCQVIFPNGEYCGFADEENNDEVEEFFELLGIFPIEYRFQHVMQLSRDFKAGLFKEAFHV